MPGSVESMAVSSVQSRKAPFGSSRRCVGSISARTGVTVALRRSGARSPGGADSGGPAAPATASAATGGDAKTLPDNWRSRASCIGLLAGGPAKAAAGSALAGASGASGRSGGAELAGGASRNGGSTRPMPGSGRSAAASFWVCALAALRVCACRVKTCA